ncbi:hypothetical protein AB0G02_40785, partial [Actinosynnema sp. NPDC023658]|uniref:hypothetical protein n=1 Tax=Actinosynnema sp. NPDC023658 TaxID=3155465 RepID=UPI0033DAE5E6
MGALPKPKTEGAGAPVREFFEALHRLHHRAGWPSLRDMAGEVGCSHTTVSVAFAGPAVPRWGLVELIVETLHGDVAEFHELWLAASSAALRRDPEPAGPPRTTATSPADPTSAAPTDAAQTG